jgi:hypothetical protein
MCQIFLSKETPIRLKVWVPVPPDTFIGETSVGSDLIVNAKVFVPVEKNESIK